MTNQALATRQRAALLQALSEAVRPISAFELHEALAARGARIGIATVYRNLRRLHADGAAVKSVGEDRV